MTDVVQALLRPDAAMTVLALLADVALKAVLILALAGVVAALLRKAAASTRHLVWTVALCSVLALPVLSVCMPSWHVLPDWSALLQQVPQGVAPPAVPEPSSPPEPVPLPELPAPPSPAEAPAAAPSAPEAPAAPSRVSPTSESDQGNALWQALGSLVDAARRAHWSVWLLLIWGGGVLLVLGRRLAGTVSMWWVARRARPVRDAAWHDLVDEIGDRLWLRRSVRLLRSPDATMPMTWGVRRPAVLLPLMADDWPEERKRCVLAHELAHVRRWDCLTQSLAQMACAFLWFNPLCWVAARQMRIEREQACDDYVLASGIRPSAYATHLLEIARSTRSSFVSPLHAVSMARPSQLEGRVLAILDSERRRKALGRITLALAVGLAALLVLPVSALRPADGEATVSESRAEVRQVAVADASDAFLWSSSINPDATVEVKAIWGDVHVSPSHDGRIEVRAHRKKGDAAHRVQIVEHEKALVICALHPNGDACTPGAWREGETGTPARIDFEIRLPASVHLVVRSIDGHIAVEDHDNVVTAETVDGDVVVETASYAQAHTVDGHVEVRMGRTTWNGKLDLTTTDGNIDLQLPGTVHAEVYAEVEDGTVRSDFDLKQRRRAEGALLWGTLGEGGRRLSLRTTDGVITLHRASGAPHARWQQQDDETDALRASLERSSETVRARVAQVLGEDGDVISIPLLADLVREDPSRRVRMTAVWALGEIGEVEAVPALGEALQDADADVRRKAAWALGEIGHPDGGPALAETLRRDGDADVRKRAAWALGEIGDERAIPVLKAALEDADSNVRQEAAGALAQIGVSDRAEEMEHDVRTRRDGRHDDVAVDVTHDAQVDVEVDGRTLSNSEAVISAILSNVAATARDVEIDGRMVERLLRGEIEWVDREYVRAMRSVGMDEEDEGLLVAARLMELDAEYVRAIRAAGYDLDLEGVLPFYFMGVEPSYLRELRVLGYEDLEPEMVIQLWHYGVDGGYLRGLASVGYRELCPEDLVAWRLHGVDDTFIREMASVGYRDLCPEEVIELRIHGIDQAFVRQHSRDGHAPPPVEDIVEMKLSGA